MNGNSTPSRTLMSKVNNIRKELCTMNQNIYLKYENKKLVIITNEINSDCNYTIPVHIINEMIHEIKINDKLPKKSFDFIIKTNKICICLHKNDSNIIMKY